MILQETYTLSNGVEIPKLGLGTWMITGDCATQAVKEAIKLGYRHIDTAQAYGNEAEVATGIKSSGLPRNEIFLTTKLAAEHKTYNDAKDAINKSLQLMNLDYIDLMIIHSPQPWNVFGGNNRFEQGNNDAWRALEDAYKEGKIRAIGLSNFNQKDIKNILASCTIKPMINQVLAHISNIPLDLIEFSQNQRLLVEAYSPVGHGELFKNQKILEMAEKYGVSLPQLCIRYDLQLGLLPLPKTANVDHMKNNAELDFIISESDMNILKNMPKIEEYGESSKFPVFRQK